MTTNSRGVIHIGVILIVIVAIGAVGYFATQNNKLKRKIITPFATNTPAESPTPTPVDDSANQEQENQKTITQIKTLNNTDWKAVTLDGVSFKIPTNATCTDDSNCSFIKIPTGNVSSTSGEEIFSTITISIEGYGGGSRRVQFSELASHDPQACNVIYEDSIFGKVKALQIAVKDCYNGGAIVTVIGDKLVVFYGHDYDPETKEVYRWDIRDTIISTLTLSN